MKEIGKAQRTQAKTSASQLQQKLESEFDIPRRIAEVIVSEAEACLQVSGEQLMSGQRWVLLVSRKVGHRQALSETALKRVCWTLDDGAADRSHLRCDKAFISRDLSRCKNIWQVWARRTGDATYEKPHAFR